METMMQPLGLGGRSPAMGRESGRSGSARPGGDRPQPSHQGLPALRPHRRQQVIQRPPALLPHPPRQPPPRVRQNQHNLPPAPRSPLTRQQTRRRHPVTQPARRRRRRPQPPRQLIQIQRPRPINDQQRTQLNRRNRRPDPLYRPLTRLKQDIEPTLHRTHPELAVPRTPPRLLKPHHTPPPATSSPPGAQRGASRSAWPSR
jgi:hypothetical protein